MTTIAVLLLSLGLLVPPTPTISPSASAVRSPATARAAADQPAAATAGSPLGTPPTPQAPLDASAAVWPLSPRPEIAERFLRPSQQWSAGHRGVDLVGTPGQSVRAALPGTVTFAAPIAGRGVVVVTHDLRRTTYEPVLASVRSGTRVSAGTVIGILQAAPGTSGHCPPQACLHWGLLDGRGYLDPLSLLDHPPIRLLAPGASGPVGP